MQKNITTLLIDLDGTVYNRDNGMIDEMTSRIARYMQEVLKIDPCAVPSILNNYYQAHGSTLRGIQDDYEIDPFEYLAYVHDLDLDYYLEPDPALRRSLASIPIRKWVFTNSDRNHTQRVLKKLGIEDLFEGILDVWTMEFIPKPHPWVYHHALEMVGDPYPEECVFIEDSARNLVPARKMGISTIWVGDGHNPAGAQYTIRDLHSAPSIIEGIAQGIPAPFIFQQPTPYPVPA